MSDSLKRSHSCGLLTKEAAGEQVVLCGWVAKRRDHGGLIFVDLRDRSGIVQIVVDPDDAGNSFTTAEAIRSEYVIKVAGKVRLRDAATVNPNLATGEIEVVAADLEVLNAAKTPPFYIQDDIDTDENLRLKYRYLDLRRPEMQKNLILRHKVTKLMRDYMDKNGFCEIETPMLTKSTPEGARDYLVPSRVNPGKFYALPQSPQIFKQILMVAGMERYFQIARCFRDEDLRADRQPEFTQLDIEMSFVDAEDIMEMMEGLMAYVFEGAMGKKIQLPMQRLTWDEAMDRFGSDKPDLRFGMELVNMSEAVKDFKSTLQDYPLEIDFEGHSSAPICSLAPLEFELAVFNLLKNAKEALRTQGADEPKVSIKISSDETYCFVNISDNGAVISDSDFERMGSVFKSGKASGLGIGLSIVRSIVQNHNGNLVIERGKYGGLICRIRLPIFRAE